MSLGCRTRHECHTSYGLSLWREDVTIIIIVQEIVFFFQFVSVSERYCTPNILFRNTNTN